MQWNDRPVCLDQYPEAPNKYRYGNSGLVMG